MAVLTSRAYAGVRDLRRMQDGLAATFATTSMHVGDLAWLTRLRTHRELALDIRLWEDEDGRLAGWSFVRSNGEFNVFVAPGHADDDLPDALLREVGAAAIAASEAGDPPMPLHTYGVAPDRSAEDAALARALERHGFEPDPSGDGLLERSLDRLPEPRAIPGYRFDPVTEGHIVQRVEAHRAAFAPSELSVRQYERVRRTWPYREGLDRVAVAEDDTVAAFCTAWIDETNAAGQLEPVGTRPEHRRRGLAAAVCLDALRALRDAGARMARVAYMTEPAERTYHSIGFVPVLPPELSYRRPTG